MKLTKSKSRAQLTDGHLNDVLLLSVSSFAPDDMSDAEAASSFTLIDFVL